MFEDWKYVGFDAFGRNIYEDSQGKRWILLPLPDVRGLPESWTGRPATLVFGGDHGRG